MNLVKTARVLHEDDVTILLEVKKDNLQPRWYRLDDELMQVAFIREYHGQLVLFEPWPIEVD